MSGVREVTERDLVECHRIDCATSAYPWSRATMNRALQKNHVSHVWVNDDDQVKGFCISLLVIDELSILNIAVSADYQRQGIGRQLMLNALTVGQRMGALEAFLEVRQSNSGAQSLYTDLEFHVVGVRENYYPVPGGQHEHALMMARTLLVD